MATDSRFPGYQLPTYPGQLSGRQADGFVTPTQDLMPQVMSIPPKRVLPIIFLPGIMGSNLRLKKVRQDEMHKSNNIAWRPEDKSESLALANGDAALRQTQLDPSQTEVDEYDPINNPTGDPGETSDERNVNAEVGFIYPPGVRFETSLLMDDPSTVKQGKTKEQKARARGWGEVFFSSYQELLEMCELRLNTAFQHGRMNELWKKVVGVPPSRWQAHPKLPLQPLTEENLKQAVKGCWFPVHAMGYNWLQSNELSGVQVSKRITKLMADYRAQGFQCEKVIVVTHSMGGLVARALIHPKMGNIHDQVLGMVHGVMPATGAGAAYKRMRCGFEDPGIVSMSPAASITSKVLGNYGAEVTAVLANAQGGLELLPSQAYGNDWLQVHHYDKQLKSLPQHGDPYEEIYKLRGRWYGLLREAWINPANRRKGAGFTDTCDLLDRAKKFHNAIASTYHEQSYAHYGADPAHPAWHRVRWSIEGHRNTLLHTTFATVRDFESLAIVGDTQQGHLTMEGGGALTTGSDDPVALVSVSMQAASDAGDQTVPLHSAEHQLSSGKFKGVFRQTGYEHQGSYSDQKALHSTLYSLVRIAQTMVWSK